MNLRPYNFLEKVYAQDSSTPTQRTTGQAITGSISNGSLNLRTRRVFRSRWNRCKKCRQSKRRESLVLGSRLARGGHQLRRRNACGCPSASAISQDIGLPQHPGTFRGDQTTRDAWVPGPLSHLPLEFVYRKSWRSARRRDGRSNKTKAQRVLELGATALCDDARDILDELQERWNRLLDPRLAPWTIQVNSANSASSCWWNGSELRRHCKAPESAAVCGLRSNTSRTSDIRWWSGKVRTARVQSEGVYARGESQTLG